MVLSNLNKKRYGILVIDMLYDFIHGELGSTNVKKIIPNINSLLEFARNANIPILFCNDSHDSTDRQLEIWGPHAMKGTKGSQVIPELKIQPNDYIVLKNTYSAFYKTDLKKILDSLYSGKGVKSIIFTGIHTDICIQHSVYDAFLSGYNIIIAEDGVSSLNIKKHNEGINYMKSNYSIQIQTIEKLLSDLNKNTIKNNDNK